MRAGLYPDLDLLFAIPNGGHRHKLTAAKLKAEGVKAGVPDLLLPVSRGQYHGLFIEMKFGRGRVRGEQQWWLYQLEAQGYQTAVCWSWLEAAKAVCDYLGIIDEDINE